MNKTAILLCSLLGAATSALAQGPVYSVNIVGIQKVTPPAGEYIQASNPFVKSGDDINTVVGNQMVGGTDYGSGDNILVWTGTEYKNYFLVDYPAEPTLHQKWVYIDDENNAIVATEGLPPGKGFWMKSNNAAPTVSFVGDVESAPTKQIMVSPGFNLISYPYSTSVELNSSAMNLVLASGCAGGTDPGDSDTISIWESNTYKTYFLVDYPAEPTLHNKWCYVDESDSQVYAANVTLQPGTSFWYKRKSAAGVLTWTTTKPY